MQVRHEKNEKIRRMRPTFFFIGLLVGLSATLAAFKWEVTTETVKIAVEEFDSDDVVEITTFKYAEEKEQEKTTKTKLLPPDPSKFKITEKPLIIDTGSTQKVVVNPLTTTGIGEKPKEIRTTEFDNEIIDVPGTFPYFDGGDGEWSRFVNNHLIVPGIVHELRQSSVNIVIKCVVEKDGSLSNFSIAKDGGSVEAAEAFIEVLKKSPKWVPGTQNMRPVRVYAYVPLKIKLD